MQEDRIGTASTVSALGATQLSDHALSEAEPAPLAEDRFTRVGQLGIGGMGVVDRIWDTDLLRELAIKRIRAERREDPSAIALFLWEARVTAYLDHPNIVPVHDLGRTASGDPYFAMKRVLGSSLEQVIRALRSKESATVERWTIQRRLRMFHQVCHAVGFAHRRGVLHRDLKPSNIMLGDDGEVVVMDWGLAVPLAGAAGERLRRVMPKGIDTASAGTPLYMSPEQARGTELDQTADVYSLGIILFELSSLERPYVAATASDVLARLADRSARTIREVWPDVPVALAAVIECATQADPERRYPTVAAFADDIERVLDGKATVAEGASHLTQFTRFYMSRDQRVARLRVIDIDMIACCGIAIGVAVGVLSADRIGSWWWVAIVVAIVTAILPVRAWLWPKQ